MTHRCIRFLIMSCVLLTFLRSHAHAADGWTTISPLQVARTNHAVVPLSSTRAFIAGGRTQGGLVISATEIFDAVSNGYVAGPTMLTPRESFSMTRLQNGKILITGGSNATGKLNSAELYDPVANTITPIPGVMNFARSGHTATLLADGTVLLAGGGNATAEIFNPSSSSFTTTTGAMPSDLTGHRAVAANGTAFIIGGRDASGTATGAILKYDRTTGTFVLAAALFAPRADFSATLLDPTTLLVVGGRNGTTPLASAELYDIAANSVTSVTGTLATARYNHQALLTRSGDVIISGGSGASAALSSCEKFTTSTGTFSTAPALPSARSGHVTIMMDNRHLVTGGVNGTTMLNTVNIYGPSASNSLTNVAFAQRSNHTATMLSSGKILIAGGYNGSCLSSAELYDPTTGTFSPTGSMTTARAYHTATMLASGKVLITGGTNGSYQSTAEIYDPATATFSPTGSMTAARAYHTATLLASGKVLITGGTNGSYQSSAEVYDPATGTFTATGSMTTARAYHTTTLLASGKVLITGGTNGSYQSTAEVYDPATGTFAATGSMTTARQYHAATLLGDGRVLVTGGYNGSYLSNAELYDPAAGTFSLAGSMATPRIYHTATLLADGRVLVTGGYNGSYLSSAELYDPAAGTFSPAGSMATARQNHTATLLASGKVLITGGYNGSYLSSAELYDPSTVAFTTTGNVTMATTRRYHTATMLTSGKVLIAGGYNGSYLSSAELYDPATGTFTPTGNMTMSRQNHTATLLADGRVLITGGGYSGGYLSTAELYDPTTGTFTTTGSMATQRANHTATLLASGKVLIAGGYYYGYLSSAEIYDPATGTFSPAASMATARAYHIATPLADGRVLIAGGYYNGYLSSAEIYDPAAGTFSSAGSMAAARQNHTATLLADGRVLIAGGNNYSYLSSAELYDPVTATFSITGSMAAARQNHTATLLADGKVLIIAGYSGSNLPSAELYDPATGTFSSTGSLATARANHTATLLADGKVLVTGGYNWSYLDSYELFDAYSSFIRHQYIPGGSFFSLQVRSMTTGQPIPGVTVSVDSGIGSQTTDANGYATFFISTPKQYGISLTATGYQSVSITSQYISGYRVALSVYMTPPNLLNMTTTSLAPAQATLVYGDRVGFTGADWPYTIAQISGQLPPGVFLYPATGQVVGTPATTGSYTFMVRVTDKDGWTAEREFTIDVSNPLMIVPTSIPRATATQPYLGVLGAQGGTSPYTFGISGAAWLTIDATTGALQGTPSTTGTQSFTVTLQDALGRTTTQSISIIIDPPLQVIAQRLDDGITSVAYSQSVTASGGLTPYTWSLFSGNLPAGLTLNPATGAISGTPTTATRSIFVLAVNDAAGRTAYRDYAINIASPLMFVTTALPNGYKDAPYSELVKVSGGIPPYTYSSTGQLAAGLTLNATTGIISGTPTIAGLTNLNITVQDSSSPRQQSVSQGMTNRIVTTLAITTTGALPNAHTGVAINPVILSAAGGTSPYAWKLVGGIMPPGLSLAGGTLSGTPTKPGDYVFTLTVTDSAATPATDTKQFICHVSDTLDIVLVDLPVAAVGVPYSQTFQASGGIPASYSWRLKDGTLPSGMSFNPTTATILGTPTTRQSYSFTLEVSDGDVPPQVAARTFNIDVVDSLNISEVSVPNGRIYQGYAAILHPLRGMPPYSWRIVNGFLPSGLTFTGSATTAQITGKPSVSGIFTFDVEITDSSNPASVFTRRYTMEIYDTVTFQTNDLKTVIRGQTYDESLVVTGGARTTVASRIFDPVAGTFSRSESMWVNRQYYTATTLPNGKVLVAGGRSGVTALASAELYDPATKSFTPAGDLTAARYQHTATLLKNGKVLIAGGTGSTPGALASAELYDPATNMFTAVGNMNDNRVYHTATLLTDGRVLITGGSDSTGPQASAETFNPANNQFTPVGNLMFPRQYHTATALADGRVLVAGGDNGILLSSVELFDPTMNSFTSGGSMNSQRSKHSSTLLSDGTVLLAGGVTVSGMPTATAEIYDPSSNVSNTTAGNMVTARSSQSATLLNDGTVLLAGGYNTSGGYISSVELYDPSLKTFRLVGSLGTAPPHEDAVLLNDGTVFFPGGYIEQYTFSIVSGSLPDGISLDPNTGALFGTTSWPAGTSSEVTFQAVDTGIPSQTAQQTLLIKVVDPLTITTANLTAQQNTAYSLALEATGGISPYASWDIVPTWATNNGNLPPGLVINKSTGVISGTPTSCGTFLVRIKIVDSWTKPNQAINDFQFNVGCASGKYMLMVQKDGAGSGTVTSSSPSGVSCGTTCGMELSHNSSITLTATPAAGSYFTGWSGACSGTSAICTITMGANMTATASFSLNLEPSGNIIANGGSSYANVNPVPLTLSASAPLASVSMMQFSVNQSPWTALVPYATNYSLSLPTGDGPYSIYVRFQDANGNYSPVYSTNVTLDTMKPLITEFDVPGTSNTATVPVTSFTANDLNGITGYYISTSSTAPAANSSLWSDVTPLSYTVSGITPGVQTTKVLYAFVKDAAGNVSLAVNSTVVITTPPQQLTVTLQGTGSGAVNSNPSGIACTSGTCSAYFNTGTQVTLMPTPAWNSDFKGWSDVTSCTTTGPCQVTLNGMTALTAQFDGKPSYLVRLIEGTTSSSYYSLNDVFDAASDGATILAQLNIFLENVVIGSNSSTSVVFKGGFDPVFGQQAGYTVVDGSVTIGKRSSVVVERLAIR